MLDFLKSNIEKVIQDIDKSCKKHSVDPSEITLCAVSKTKSIEYIDTAFKCGLKVFGENYVQEIQSKFTAEKKDYKLHLIGHLQSNKVSKVLPFVDSIDSVDSLRLLEKIENALSLSSRKMDVMLEYNSSHDASKTGFTGTDELRRALDVISSLRHINFTGMMTMGPLGGDEGRIRESFVEFMDIYNTLKSEYSHLNFIYKSFGMSSDYDIAIEEGSNFLRIGTAIFGNRI